MLTHGIFGFHHRRNWTKLKNSKYHRIFVASFISFPLFLFQPSLNKHLKKAHTETFVPSFTLNAKTMIWTVYQMVWSLTVRRTHKILNNRKKKKQQQQQQHHRTQKTYYRCWCAVDCCRLRCIWFGVPCSLSDFSTRSHFGIIKYAQAAAQTIWWLWCSALVAPKYGRLSRAPATI